MNPIFARRNRASPTQSNAGQSHRSPSSGFTSVRHASGVSDDVSPTENLAACGSKNPKLIVTAPPINANLVAHRYAAKSRAAQEAHDQMLLAQNFLASKQNLLAQSVLTPAENSARRRGQPKSLKSQAAGGACALIMSDSEEAADEVTAFEAVSRQTPDDMINGAQSLRRGDMVKMDFCDIEDEDFDFGDVEPCSSTNRAGAGCDNLRQVSGAFGNIDCTVSTIDAKLWKELKAIVVGPNGTLLEGWHFQGFTFDTCLPYGLVQKRGGPCGVLAVVQSLVLRNLMYGSPYAEEGDDDLPFPEPVVNYAADPTFNRLIAARRTKALVLALTEILWRCSRIGSKGYFHFEDSRHQDTEIICNQSNSYPKIYLSPNKVGTEIKHFKNVSQLRSFIGGNLAKLDCANLVYSAVLSRGVQAVQEDFDFPNCPLLGAHGYCSQELVNLLSTGKAVSNVFDNQVPLDGKVLKGIEARADIGFLSLFEHYDSCQVGTHLKCPKFPIWIVCSESHFSVLFSMEEELAQDLDATFAKFDLYYYDGLAKQQNHIKLTVTVDASSTTASGFRQSRSYYSGNGNNNNEDVDTDDDLIPPLEKCIRTKWKSATVDWNKTEPIL